MSPYYNDGQLTTDKQTIDDSHSWDTQAEWAAYQSKNNLSVSNGVVELAQVPVIDDFEDNDMSEYGGNTAAWTTVTSPVAEGTYAGQGSVGSGGGSSSIASTSGLSAYPELGDTFRCEIQAGSPGGLFLIGFFAQSATSLPDGYYAVLDHAGGTFRIRRRSSGNNTTLVQDTSVNYTGLSSGFWSVQMATTLDNTLTFTLYDASGTQVSEVSTTDATFTSGGVMYQVYDSSAANSMTVDYYRVVG